MTERVVAYRVDEGTFTALDALRKGRSENWKVFTLRCIAHRFADSEVAGKIAIELGEKAEPEVEETPGSDEGGVVSTPETRAKRPKKAKGKKPTMKPKPQTESSEQPEQGEAAD